MQGEAARQRTRLGLPSDVFKPSEVNGALAIVQSASEHAIVTLDLGGRITGWNLGAVNNLGWNEGEVLGRDAGKLIFTPEDQANGQPEREMALARTEGHATDERWHIRKDGLFFAQGEMTPLLNPEGSQVGYVKVFRDRTAQRLAEDAAREAATELRQLTDALPVLVAIVGPDHRYRFVNHHYETWFGVPRERVIGMHARDLVGETAYQARLAQIERALAGETVEYEGYLPDRNGEKRACHILYIPRRTADGSVDGFYVQVMDITERKRAVEATRRADERIRLALDSGAVVGTWVWDVPEDRFTSDARFARTFSLDPAAMERGVRLADVVQSIHPDDEPRVQGLIARALQDGGPYSAEYRVRQLDGSYHWIEANGHVTHDDGGRPIRFPGVLVNIDQRKRVEESQTALLHLGDRLRMLDAVGDIAAAAAEIVGTRLELQHTGYGAVDPSQTFVDVDRDWCASAILPSVAGRHRFSDYGSHIENLKRGEVVAISDVERDSRTAAEAKALGTLGIKAFLNVPLLDQNRLVGVFFLHDDKPRVWSEEDVIFIRAVVDRTWVAMTKAEAAHALRQLNDTLEQRVADAIKDRDRIWKLSRDPFLIADREGHWLNVSPAWADILGWSEEELLGRTSEWMEHPDDRTKTRQEIGFLSDGNTTLKFENRFRTKGGDYRWFSWTAVPSGEILYCVARDITEAKQLAAERESLEAQLHQSQKMEAVGQLTGGMAHDFNNLLQAMSGCLQLVGRRAGHVAGVQKILDSGRQAVDRGASMVRQLMAFSRRQSLQPEPFDVRDRLLGMRAFLDRALRADIQLEFDLEAGLWPVMADPVQFELTVLNLATNARDAIAAAGRVMIGAGNVECRGEDGLRGGFVRVWVQDSGQGIPPEALERVFEPFFTTKAVGQGTGLGLAQVYGFCRQSGGSATVESVVGQGTTVTLLLPRAAAEPAIEAEARRVAVSGNGLRVLLVEDDPVVAPVIVTALEDLGYSVARAATGEEALRRLQEGEPVDVLFSDVVMPGTVDGIALAQAARELLPGLVVVLATGYSENQAGMEGLPVLSKPYRIEDLGTVFQTELNRKKRRL
nr:PAS domain S-box protein [Azospirillum sp. SYSU D00513]